MSYNINDVRCILELLIDDKIEINLFHWKREGRKLKISPQSLLSGAEKTGWLFVFQTWRLDVQSDLLELISKLPEKKESF